MLRFGSLAFGATVLAMFADPGFADRDEAKATESDLTQAVFSAAERALAADYCGGAAPDNAGNKAMDRNEGTKADKRNNGKGVGPHGPPPGLAKIQELSPGLAKRRLPAVLTAQLPPAPAGFERAIIDTDLLLVETATQIIHDVITRIVTK